MPEWLTRFCLYLAPMAGVSDLVFRSLCKELGADVVETEFVSAEGVLQAWNRTHSYVEISDSQRPVGVQIFGSNAANMQEAARIICGEIHPDFIDLNAGCPVPKVVGHNGGSSLLREPELLQRITEALVRGVGESCPITAKIRIGWDAEHICAHEICHRLAQAGVASITIHGRTRSQQYGGRANWDIIRECAAAETVPIIGNGDLATAQDVAREWRTGGVAGVMIGRAAMTNPWIFREAKHLMKTGSPLAPPSTAERVEFILRHVRLELEHGRYGDESSTLRTMRARLLAYAKGIPGSKSYRPALARVSSLAELREILADLSSDG